jgi:hypothetical protein
VSEVWLHHPNLPGQDIKVLRGALGNYARGGWQEREDQSDPVDPDTILDEPAGEQDDTEPAATSDSTSVDTTPDVDGEPVADEPATSTTTKKGR